MITDLPKGQGTIAYRKVVIDGGKLVGAILLGHRSEHVRRHGLRLRKLIADGTDVSEIADQLLDPTFDLPAWMAAASGEDRKASTGIALGGAVPTYSRLFRIPDLASPLSRQIAIPKGMAMASPSLLPAPPQAAAAGIAVLEPPAPVGGGPGPRATLQIEGGAAVELGEIARIGRRPESELVVGDPLVSGTHAEIRLIGDDYVLADAGSRNDTSWVTGRSWRPPFCRTATVSGWGTRRSCSRSRRRWGPPPARRPRPNPSRRPAPPTRPPSDPRCRACSSRRTRSRSRPRPRRWRSVRSRAPGSASSCWGLVISIGRDRAADISLPNQRVGDARAARRARWPSVPPRPREPNGTYANRRLVSEPHLLEDGDVIHVGDTDLAYRAASTATAEVPPAVAPAIPELVAPPGPAPGLPPLRRRRHPPAPTKPVSPLPQPPATPAAPLAPPPSLRAPGRRPARSGSSWGRDRSWGWRSSWRRPRSWSAAIRRRMSRSRNRR